MSEIDDLYQENVETLDNEFFENFKKGKKKKDIVKHYRDNLEKHRTTFEQHYQKALQKEKQQASKKKKKKEKKEKYEVINIKRFDFNFSTWQKIKFRLAIRWFKISRAYHKATNKFIPAWIMYLFYKVLITWKAFYRETRRFIGNIIEAVKKFLIKTGKKIVKTAKILWKKFLEGIKTLLGLIMFWKKKDKKKEGEKEGTEEKLNEQGSDTEKEQGEEKEEKNEDATQEEKAQT